MNYRVYAAALLLTLLPAAGPAQIPQKPQNLEVLPADMTSQAVVARMRDITSALGVRCQFCHDGPEGPDLDLVNFASDAKPAKQTARAMMRMVQRINDDLLAGVPNRGEPAIALDCITCHRGAPRPLMLEDTLEKVVLAAGVDTALATYAALRQRYYGRFAYDFGERSLNVLAGRLRAAQRNAESVRVLELNAERFPDSWNVANLLAGAYESVADTTRAIEQYRKVLRFFPDHAGAQRRLRALTGGP